MVSGENSPKPEPTQEDACQDCIQSFPAPDTSNWKTYRNEELGFEIKYPEKVTPFDISEKVQAYFIKLERECREGLREDCGGGGQIPNPVVRFLSSSELTDDLSINPLDVPYDYTVEVYDKTPNLVFESDDKVEMNRITWSQAVLGEGYERQSGLLPERILRYVTEKDSEVYVIRFSSKYAPPLFSNVAKGVISTFKFIK